MRRHTPLDLTAEAAAAAKARADDEAATRAMALREVADSLIAWRTDLGVEGGFVYATDAHVPEPSVLIALWTLRHHGLIGIVGQAVHVTSVGAGLVSGWDGTEVPTAHGRQALEVGGRRG